MPRLAELLKKNPDGHGPKPALNLRAPEAFKQAARHMAQEESLAQGRSISMSEIVVAAALKDQRLRQLASQYARQADQVSGQA